MSYRADFNLPPPPSFKIDYRDEPPGFSEDLSMLEYKDILTECIDSDPTKDRWGRERPAKSDWPGTYRSKRVILTLEPLTDVAQIERRQNAIRYFARCHQEGNTAVVRAMRHMLAHHSQMYDDFTSDTRKPESMLSVVHRFSEFARAASVLEHELAKSEVMQSFAEALAGLYEQDHAPIMWKARNFDKRDGRMVLRDYHAYNGMTSLKNAGALELGIYEVEKKSILYTGEDTDLGNIGELVLHVAPLVYTLGCFFYQGKVLHNRTKWELPVCLPEINDEGFFQIKDAEPAASNVEVPVRFDFSYDREDNKILLSGAHSGGKTELLLNLFLIHVNALAGNILFCNDGQVPIIDHWVSRFSKGKREGAGSLEGEVYEVSADIKTFGRRTIAFVDEFLDTTKPEIADHIEEPLLGRMEETEATIILVSHRAAALADDIGFRFMYPELREIEVPVRERIYDEYQGFHYWIDTDKKRKRLRPTRKFLTGKPPAEETARHAQEMWQDMKEEN